MLGWLLGRKPKLDRRERPAARGGNVRGYESAQTTRTNAKHWAGRGVSEADAYIIPNLETTRWRCRHEIRESGHAKGIVETYVHDLVGRCGPRPQVQLRGVSHGELQLAAPEDDFAQWAEAQWDAWCEVADAQGRLHWCDLLAQNVRQFFAAGEYLNQLVTDKNARGVQLRLLTIAPERLGTPWSMYADTSIRGGVEIDGVGRPVAYHILDQHPGSMFGQLRNTASSRILAADIRHVYRSDEPGQTRGEPWLAPSLDDFVQLRDFVSDTLTAARIAATLGSVFFQTDHPASGFQQFDNGDLPIMDIEAGVATALPEGWKAAQMKPEHPSATFSEFVKSRLAAFGRPIGMPYLRVACDASGHNYSSARLDLQTYFQGIASTQGFLERADINLTFRAVIAEAALAAGRDVPEYRVTWMWPPAPSIDDAKEAEARKARFASGTTTLARECTAIGDDWQQVQEQQKRERDNAERLGIPYPEVGNAPAAAPDNSTQDATSNVDNTIAA